MPGLHKISIFWSNECSRANTATVEVPNYDLLKADIHICQKNEFLYGTSVHIHRLEEVIHSRKHRRWTRRNLLTYFNSSRLIHVDSLRRIFCLLIDECLVLLQRWEKFWLIVNEVYSWHFRWIIQENRNVKSSTHRWDRNLARDVWMCYVQYLRWGDFCFTIGALIFSVSIRGRHWNFSRSFF